MMLRNTLLLSFLLFLSSVSYSQNSNANPGGTGIYTGEIEVTIVDDFKNNTSYKEYALITQYGRYSLPDMKPDQQFSPNADVEIKGIRSGNSIMTQSFRTINTGPGMHNMKSSSNGTLRVLILLITFLDSKAPNFTPDDAFQKYFGYNSGTRKYFRENSYGKFDITGDVLDWYTLNRKGLDYNPNYTYVSMEEIGTIITHYKIDLKNYDRILTIVNHPRSDNPHAVVGNYQYKIADQDFYGAHFYIPYDSSNVRFYKNIDFGEFDNYIGQVFCHELGHTLGLDHASAWEVKDGNTKWIEYGNPFDVMGRSEYAMHYNAIFKEGLGWLDSTSVLKIDSSGIYTIKVYERPWGIRAAKIRVPDSTDYYYYLEYRQALGYDNLLNYDPGGFEGLLEYNQKGLYVNVKETLLGFNFFNMDRDPPIHKSFLLDMAPNDGLTKYHIGDWGVVTLFGDNIYEDKVHEINLGPIIELNDSSITFQVKLKPSLNNPYKLTASRLSPFRVKLKWEGNTTSDDGYRIEKSAGKNTKYETIDSVAANINEYTDINASDTSPYDYRIRPYSHGHYFNSSNSVHLKGAINSAPLLISPGKGDTKLSVRPSLKWHLAGFGVNTYQVQIAADSLFNQIEYDRENVPDTCIKVAPVKYNAKHYWRVRAADNWLISNWSEVRDFKTELIKLVLQQDGFGTGKIKVNGVLYSLPATISYDSSNAVTLEAVPESGSSFAGFLGAISSTKYQVTATADKNMMVLLRFNNRQFANCKTLTFMEDPVLPTYYEKGGGFMTGTNGMGMVGFYEEFEKLMTANDSEDPKDIYGCRFNFGYATVTGHPDTIRIVVIPENALGEPSKVAYYETFLTTDKLITQPEGNIVSFGNPIRLNSSVFIGYEFTKTHDDTVALYSNSGFGQCNERAWRKSGRDIYSRIGCNFDLGITAYYTDGKNTSVEKEKKIPTIYYLNQNYPNPFNPVTKIAYSIPLASSVRIAVYNILGEKVNELLNTIQPAGFYEISFNASNISSGVYFYTIYAVSTDGTKEFKQTRKMVVVK